MKKYKFIVSVICYSISLLFFQSYAQQTDRNTELITNYFQSIKEVSTQIDNTKLNTVAQNLNTYVLIQQVGDNNAVELKGSVNDSQTVNQVGNTNQYSFINYYNKTGSDLNITQQGNSNSLQIYGVNSIIKNLEIVQSGNFKAIVIKNY